MVHDNAANMNLASELSKWDKFGCSAHTLQLAVNHAFEKSKVTDVITSASRLVSHFRHFLDFRHFRHSFHRTAKNTLYENESSNKETDAPRQNKVE